MQYCASLLHPVKPSKLSSHSSICPPNFPKVLRDKTHNFGIYPVTTALLMNVTTPSPALESEHSTSVNG
ncbi:hypothetical protein BT69DRAFT_1282839 [Atractiella rhizophila]|nr:hypothetical protein BT69DRAFT_1282839 [Atractiella rhizophila]